MEGPRAAMGTPLTERGGRSTRQALVTRQCSVLSPLYLCRRPILRRPGGLALPAIEPATENLRGERRGRFIDFFHGATPPRRNLPPRQKLPFPAIPSQVSTPCGSKFPRWQPIPRGEKPRVSRGSPIFPRETEEWRMCPSRSQERASKRSDTSCRSRGHLANCALPLGVPARNSLGNVGSDACSLADRCDGNPSEISTRPAHDSAAPRSPSSAFAVYDSSKRVIPRVIPPPHRAHAPDVYQTRRAGRCCVVKQRAAVPRCPEPA